MHKCGLGVRNGLPQTPNFAERGLSGGIDTCLVTMGLFVKKFCETTQW